MTDEDVKQARERLLSMERSEKQTRFECVSWSFPLVSSVFIFSHDSEIRELQARKNELESFIYSSKDKIQSDKHVQKTTLENERKSSLEAVSDIENWFNEDSYTADLETVKEKLDLLHSFRVYFNIFSTRFECGFTSSPLVSSVTVQANTTSLKSWSHYWSLH